MDRKIIAINAYKKGMSMNQAGKLVGAVGQSVKSWLVAAGVEIRYSRPTYSKKTIEDALSLYIENELSAEQVAKKMKLKTHTVKQWLRDRGLFRTMSEAACLHISGGGGQPQVRGSKLWYVKEGCGSKIRADSSYEYIRMQQLDSDEDVLQWERCVDAIQYTDPFGKLKTYNPDFKVLRKSKGWVVEEVKPKALVRKKINQLKAFAASVYYKNQAIEYVFITEDEIGYVKSMGSMLMTIEESKERAKLMRRERIKRMSPEDKKEYTAKNTARHKKWRDSKKTNKE